MISWIFQRSENRYEIDKYMLSRTENRSSFICCYPDVWRYWEAYNDEGHVWCFINIFLNILSKLDRWLLSWTLYFWFLYLWQINPHFDLLMPWNDVEKQKKNISTWVLNYFFVEKFWWNIKLCSHATFSACSFPPKLESSTYLCCGKKS